MSQCSNCGKSISNPTSLRFGMGPICRGSNIHTKFCDGMQGKPIPKNASKTIDETSHAMGLPEQKSLDNISKERIFEEAQRVRELFEKEGLLEVEQREDKVIDAIIDPKNADKLERVFKHLYENPLDLSEDMTVEDIFNPKEEKKRIPWCRVRDKLFTYTKKGAINTFNALDSGVRAVESATITSIFVAYRLSTMVELALMSPFALTSKDCKEAFKNKINTARNIEGLLLLSNAMVKKKNPKEINKILRKKKIHNNKLAKYLYKGYLMRKDIQKEIRKEKKAKSERQRFAKKTGKPIKLSRKELSHQERVENRKYQEGVLREEARRKVLLDNLGRKLGELRGDLGGDLTSVSPEKRAEVKKKVERALKDFASTTKRKKTAKVSRKSLEDFNKKIDKIGSYNSQILDLHKKALEYTQKNDQIGVQKTLNKIEEVKGLQRKVA